MLQFPAIDPAIHLGPLTIRWYALMYILGFVVAYFVTEWRVKETRIPFGKYDSGDLITGEIFGLLIGARLGFVLFYQPQYYLLHPDKILAVWEGGMSFHGGFIGVLLVAVMFCRKRGISFLQLCDTVAPAAPIGLALGRLGNFINGELWGKPSSLPWAMVFPSDPLHVPRHPSQLYELFLEGVVLTTVLWSVRNRPMPHGTLLGLFIAGYGVCRIICECFREPDAGLILGFSRGIALSVPMVLAGLALIFWVKTRSNRGEAAQHPAAEGA